MDSILATSNPASFKSLIGNARGVVVFAGAGMSVEFGIPTYWDGPAARYADQRSHWGYTALEHASGLLWETEPEVQVAYHDQRLAEIDSAFAGAPADNSYSLLGDFLRGNSIPHFAVTSNVDGAFQHFGFEPDSVYEVHGTSHFSQCLANPKQHGIIPAQPGNLCPECGSWLRPNTLFFDDFAFNPEREMDQCMRYNDFVDADLTGYLLLEIGVGATVPRVRDLATRLHYETGASYLHVNPNIDSGTSFTQLTTLMGRSKRQGRPESWLTLKSLDAMMALKP